MKIALVSCPHAIGWCYLVDQPPGYMARLPCPCNDRSTVVAEFDALDLIRQLSPDGSVERGMQNPPAATVPVRGAEQHTTQEEHHA